MHQSYDASTEVTARTKTRSPRTYANTSESGLFFLESTPVLGLVPWLEPSETVKLGTIWETFFVPMDPASPCRARSQTVLLNRARFQIVLRDRALMPGVVPHSSSTDEEFFQISACPNFSAKRGCWSVTVFFVQYNRNVYHSIKELHLWNLPCLPNCLDERYLALDHH